MYPIAEAIHRKHYNYSIHSSNPFVLKAVAIGTNYNNSERTKLEQVKTKHGISIFNKLGIDETKGDRLLVLMDLPETERLSHFQELLVQIAAEFNT